MRSVGRDVAPGLAGVGIAAAVLFSPYGLDPRDVVAWLDASVAARVFWFAAAVLFCGSAARAALAPPGHVLLRSSPVPRALLLGHAGAVLISAALPLAIVVGAGAGALRGAATALAIATLALSRHVVSDLRGLAGLLSAAVALAIQAQAPEAGAAGAAAGFAVCVPAAHRVAPEMAQRSWSVRRAGLGSRWPSHMRSPPSVRTRRGPRARPCSDRSACSWRRPSRRAALRPTRSKRCGAPGRASRSRSPLRSRRSRRCSRGPDGRCRRSCAPAARRPPSSSPASSPCPRSARSWSVQRSAPWHPVSTTAPARQRQRSARSCRSRSARPCCCSSAAPCAGGARRRDAVAALGVEWLVLGFAALVVSNLSATAASMLSALVSAVGARALSKGEP